MIYLQIWKPKIYQHYRLHKFVCAIYNLLNFVKNIFTLDVKCCGYLCTLQQIAPYSTLHSTHFLSEMSQFHYSGIPKVE